MLRPGSFYAASQPIIWITEVGGSQQDLRIRYWFWLQLGHLPAELRPQAVEPIVLRRSMKYGGSFSAAHGSASLCRLRR